MKLGMAEGHVGSLDRVKFLANRCPGWERGPQTGKNFQFLVKSRPAGANPLTDFMLTIILQKCFKFDVIHSTGYRVIAEKPRVGHLGLFFPSTV